MRPLSCVVVCLLLGLGQLAWAEQPQAPIPGVPAAKWKAGDTWKIAVELMSNMAQKQRPEPGVVIPENNIAGTARLSVEVLGLEVLEGRQCWVLDFKIEDDPAKLYSQRQFHVWVNSQGGEIRKVWDVASNGFAFSNICHFGDTTVIDASPRGFPVATIPDVSQAKVDLVAADPLVHLQIRQDFEKSKNDKIPAASVSREVKRVLLSRDGTVLQEWGRVSQKWTAGQAWWSEYEEYQAGFLIMRATLISSDSHHPPPKRNKEA